MKNMLIKRKVKKNGSLKILNKICPHLAEVFRYAIWKKINYQY